MKFKEVKNIKIYSILEFSLEEIVIFLNENFTGWIKIYPELHTHFVHVIKWSINAVTNKILTFRYDKYFYNSQIGVIQEINGNYDIRLEKIDEIMKYEIIENRIFSEQDPYGEEDWLKENYKIKKFDDIFEGFLDWFKKKKKEENILKQERIKKRFKPIEFEFEKIYVFSSILRFDLLGKKRLDWLREELDDQFIIIFNGEQQTRGRLVNIKPFKIRDRQYYTITLITKTGEEEVNINDRSRFKIKTPQESKMDPYDEEDWEIHSTPKNVQIKEKNKPGDEEKEISIRKFDWEDEW